MYTVRLPNFEGPLELLLFFVKRDELDIYDIPIARITEEFLAYVRLMQLVDLELAGEFLVMAATLMRIKAQMLLPRPETGSEEHPADDPRTELVHQLIEYSRYRDLADELEGRFQQQRYVYYRTLLAQQPPPEQVDYINATLFDLLSALHKLVQRHSSNQPQTPYILEREHYSVEEQMHTIEVTLAQQPRVRFGELVAGRSRAYIVATFLALLELCKNGAVALRQSSLEEDIVVEALEIPEHHEEVIAQ